MNMTNVRLKNRLNTCNSEVPEKQDADKIAAGLRCSKLSLLIMLKLEYET